MSKDKKAAATKILDLLKLEFPVAASALAFTNPLELLIATILSAQATDKLVNTVTPELFKRYKTATAYADAPIKEIEAGISRINFFHNKAKAIKGCCADIVNKFGGTVPQSLDELVTLPGVGRKTANVVLGNAFGKDALAVDTHVKRVAGRLGLSSSDDADKVEEDLCRIIDKKRWTETSHLFILHGRKTCKARRPLCEACRIKGLCEYYKTKAPSGVSS